MIATIQRSRTRSYNEEHTGAGARTPAWRQMQFVGPEPTGASDRRLFLMVEHAIARLRTDYATCAPAKDVKNRTAIPPSRQAIWPQLLFIDSA